MDGVLDAAAAWLVGRGVQLASIVALKSRNAGNRNAGMPLPRRKSGSKALGIVAAARSDARFDVDEWRGEATMALRGGAFHLRGARPPKTAAEKYEKRTEEKARRAADDADADTDNDTDATAALNAALVAAALDVAAVWLRGHGVQRMCDLGVELAAKNARVPRIKGRPRHPRLTLASAARSDARFFVSKWGDDTTIALRDESPHPRGSRPPYSKTEKKTAEKEESIASENRKKARALSAALDAIRERSAATGVGTTDTSGVTMTALPRLTECLAKSDPASYVALVEAAACASPAVALEIFRTSYAGMGTITQLGMVGGGFSESAYSAVYSLIVRAASADAQAVTKCFPKSCPGCLWLHLTLPVALYPWLDSAAGDAMRALICDDDQRIIERGEVAALASGLRAAWHAKAAELGALNRTRRAFPGYGICTEFDSKFCLHVATRAGRLLTSASLRNAMRARGGRADRAVRKVTAYLSEECEWESGEES